MLAELGLNQPSGKLREAKNLVEALTKAQNYCRDCKVSSPVVCMERCDVWRVKHEIHETERIISQTNHARQLSNALKNRRRLKILEALYQCPSSLRELQRALRESGFSHSRRTISQAYLKSMLRVGLIKEEGGGFKATFYGRKVHELLAGLGSLNLLPLHSCCYEETVLKELTKPRTFNELATRVPKKSLSRILMRLRAKGLLVKSVRSDFVYYHRAKGKPKAKLSPTERRVFDAIPQEGIPAR
jgi:DNA-binding HxlR family transcriptional regulator